MDVAAARPRRRSAPATVWALNGLLAAGGVAAYTGVSALAPVDAPFALPWWAFVLLFALAERLVVEVQIGRDAHSFSVTEVIVVLGLFFAAPAALPLAHVAGALLAQIRTPNLVPSKLVFNLSGLFLETCLAIIVFRALSGLVAADSMLAWAVAVPATLVVAPIMGTAVFVAIWLAEGQLLLGRLLSVIGLSLLGTVTNTLIGLMGVRLLWHDPADGWLVAVPAVMVLVAYRGYVVQWRRREGMELLYECSRLLQQSRDVEGSILALLTHARDVFNAGYVESIVFLGGDDDVPFRTTLHGRGHALMEPLSDDDGRAFALQLSASPQPHLLTRRGHPEVLAWLRERGFTSGMVAPMRTDYGSIGALVVGNRLREPARFDNEELRLFGMLANHAGVALTNDRLERSLAQANELKEQLRQQALHDSLTGLANRALFTQRLEAALARPPDTGLVGALYVDLDDFKLVNDTLGHDAGDQLLITVGERLQRCLRPADTVARLGGDEFAAVIDGAIHVDEAKLAARIVDALREPVLLGDQLAVVGASVGIAIGRPGTIGLAELVRNADTAMYHAKRAGKNCYAVYAPGMEHVETPTDAGR